MHTQSENCTTLTKKDFANDQLVKWCPGCGDYAILSAMQNALPQIGKKREDIVFVSGIGCSSRFPYYMNTYGFHTIHGRAAAIASGVKLANPDLSVWEITGDGDALAIGGNHFIHLIRRNIDVNIILFNNRIYGLTKGQFSPTSPLGTKTKSSPNGTIEEPFSPLELAIGAKSTFIARATDSNPKLMTEIFVKANQHKGTSLVEVLQNCVIFNDGAFDNITAKDVKDENQILLEDGKPMIFGKDKNKGLILNGLELKAVTIGENGISESDILIHNSKTQNSTLHRMLAEMKLPELPIAIGVIRDVEQPSYDQKMMEEIDFQKQKSSFTSVSNYLKSKDSWTVN